MSSALQAARWKYRTQKDRHLGTIAQIVGLIFATKAYIDNRKKLVKQHTFSTCPDDMVNFGPAAEIGLLVWGTPANFNGFRVLAALLHGTPVVGISQTLWRWTESATYIRHGGHHVGHWPTFLVLKMLLFKKKPREMAY